MENFYHTNDIRDFEKRILAEGNCDSFLPMSFTELEEGLRVIYSLQGYAKIDYEQLKSPYALLQVLEKVVLKAKRAENHFILNERYEIKMDCIYVSEDKTNIKFLFLPMNQRGLKEEKPHFSFCEKIEAFLEELQSRTDEQRSKEYMEMLDLKMKRANLSKQGIVNYIGELKREAYLCGWE